MRTKNSKNIDAVLKNIPLIRTKCLHKHVRSVQNVIAYCIKYYDGKNLTDTIDSAIANSGSEDFTKIVTEYKLNLYNDFSTSFNDILLKVNEPFFGEYCYMNNLDANYIKGVSRRGY